jgi:hypothetical protein
MLPVAFRLQSTSLVFYTFTHEIAFFEKIF